jgi:hypothetical protein
MKKQLTKTYTNKKAMVAALEKSLGVVSVACRNVDISRMTHYEWYKNDPEYKMAVDSLKDVALDFAESALHKQISNGNPTSTIFYLKTKGKARGYTEKQEVEFTGSGELLHKIELVTKDELDLKQIDFKDT